MKITLRQLRVFDAVASLGSISKAADALNVTQSTASAALKELQSQLDRPPLFNHVGRTLQITAEGLRLQPLVRTLLQRAEEIEHPPLDEELTGTISVGVGEVGGNIIPRLAAEFHRRHPRVRITVTYGLTYEITSLLNRFVLDSIVTTNLTRAPGVYLTEIYRERSVIIAAPDHPLAADPAPSFAALAKAEWCMAPRTSSSNQRMMDVFRGHISNFKLAIEINSDEAIREAVRAGCGISCLPAALVETDLANGSLVELKVPELKTLRPVFLVRMTNVERSLAARAFDDFIVDAFAELSGEGVDAKG